MIVRPYTEADLETFKRIHADSGLNYRFPDLNSPLFIVKTVVERAGKPTMLAAARIEAEAYLITTGTPQDKWEDIQAAQKVFLAELWKQGLDNVYACVPDEIGKHFGKRMSSLGWTKGREGWTNWFRDTV